MRIPFLGAVDLVLEKAGNRPYTHPQTFVVEYSVQVKNLAETTQNCVVVLPCVREGGDQSILKSPVFVPDAEKSREEVWQNEYVSWQLELPAQGTKDVIQSFTVQVRPSQSYEQMEGMMVGDRLRDSAERAQALQENKFIHPTRQDIQALAKKIVGTEQRVISMLRRLNVYVSQNIVYGDPIPGLYSDEEALTKKVVDCGGFASLYCSLAISLGIPSRIVSGFWAGYPKNRMHAWAESLLPNGIWIPVDPSMENLRERGATSKSGRFGYLGSDRIVLSRGCDISFETNGKKIQTDILQNPIVMADQGEPSVEMTFNFTTQDH